jgi:hypothetical protein
MSSWQRKSLLTDTTRSLERFWKLLFWYTLLLFFFRWPVVIHCFQEVLRRSVDINGRNEVFFVSLSPAEFLFWLRLELLFRFILFFIDFNIALQIKRNFIDWKFGQWTFRRTLIKWLQKTWFSFKHGQEKLSIEISIFAPKNVVDDRWKFFDPLADSDLLIFGKKVVKVWKDLFNSVFVLQLNQM